MVQSTQTSGVLAGHPAASSCSLTASAPPQLNEETIKILKELKTFIEKNGSGEKEHISFEYFPREALETFIYGEGLQARPRNALRLLAQALDSAVENNSGAATQIAQLLAELIQKIANNSAALEGFIRGCSQKDTEGFNAFYWLALALNWAVNNNSDTAPQIAQLLAELIQKIANNSAALEDFIRGCSQKDTKGFNAFYWLANALNLAFQKNSGAAPQIAQLLAELAGKVTDNPKLLEAFIDACSQSDPHGRNAFYRLACALDWAAYSTNSDAAPQIAQLLAELIKKIADHSAALEAFIDACSQSDPQDRNTFYCLAKPLSWAACRRNSNAAPQIAQLFAELIKKIADHSAALEAFIRGCSQKDAEDFNAFYWLAKALDWAVECNSGAAPQIAQLLAELIKKITDDPKALKAFIDGCSQSDPQGRNAFYFLTLALNWAVKHNPDTAPQIAQLLAELIKKIADHSAALEAFIRGCSQKDTEGFNAFYFLALALNWSVEHNPDTAPQIAQLLAELIKKIADHSAALEAFIGNCSGRGAEGFNAFYWLAKALHWAVEHNSGAAPQIAQLLAELAGKITDNPKVLKAFIDACSQKNTEGFNAFYWLAKALHWAAKNNSGAAPQIAQLLAELIKKIADNPEALEAFIRGCSEKVDEGSNAFYFLALALNWSVEHNPDTVPQIAQLLAELIEKNADNLEALEAFIGNCSERGAEGFNALYRLANALNLAFQKNSGAATQIAQLIRKIARNPAALTAFIDDCSQSRPQDRNAFYWLTAFWRANQACSGTDEKGGLEILSDLIDKFSDTGLDLLFKQRLKGDVAGLILKTIELRLEQSWQASTPGVSTESMFRILKLLVRLANDYKKQTLPGQKVKNSERLKTMFNQLFEWLKGAKNIDEQEFSDFRRLFVETGLPKQYLKQYCSEQRTNTASFFTQSLKRDSYLGRLVDTQKNIHHKGETRTRRELSKLQRKLTSPPSPRLRA